ncbi:galactose mutarotase [Mariniblastus sp.]|nr:galactose mutarotase [Mariniblastus sp.]
MKNIVYLLILWTSLFAQVVSAQSLKPSITLTEFGTFEGQPVTLYTLTNKQGMVAKISNYGGIVVSLKAPDRKGKLEDVVLGYDNFDAYKTDTGWYGAIAGRNANRIKAGKFSIDGKQYQLATNNGPNNLHGGEKGFNKKRWQATPSVSSGEPKLTLKYMSPDGEEGFPGNLTVTTTYTLTQDNALKIQYHATTNQPTVCNLTHHSYWNIAGPNSDSILDQQLQLFCDAYNPIDETGIPTGETRSVEGTPFDFRQPKAIGRDINTADAQLKLGKGYDHNFVINGEPGQLRPVAKLHDPNSGRVMEVLSTDYGVQFYSGNWFDGSVSGRTGKFKYRTALCLECQHLPDSVNQPNFKSAILRPGETYEKTTLYRFSVK